MCGLIIYIDKEGKEQRCYVQGMKYTESPAEYLERHGIEFERTVEFWESE